MEPAVSVVIPTWNRRALVLEAVESVLAQTRSDLELVVVDDGSTDDTVEVLRSRLEAEPRAHVLRQANSGTAAARNRGLDAARAPWTAFLDDDDLWEPGYLASQLALLARRPEADLVVADVVYENQDRDVDSMFADPDFVAPTSLDAMLAGAWALPSGIVVRTDLARRIRFDPAWDLIEDTEFLMRVNAEGRRCVLNSDRLVRWRRPGGDVAPAKSLRQWEMELAMLKLLELHRRRAADPRAVARRLYERQRKAAKTLVAAGRLRAARPHLHAWIAARPGHLRPLVTWLRSFLPFARA